MINYKLKIFSTVLVTAMFVSNAKATDFTSGSASAEIMSKITISETTAIAFGNIAHDNSSQTVSISDTGTLTCPGVYECNGTATQGVLSVEGTTGQTADISYTNGTISDGTNTLTLTVNSGNDATITFTAGADALNVGASITLGATQAAGTYNTSNASGVPYQVSVNYQ